MRGLTSLREIIIYRLKLCFDCYTWLKDKAMAEWIPAINLISQLIPSTRVTTAPQEKTQYTIKKDKNNVFLIEKYRNYCFRLTWFKLHRISIFFWQIVYPCQSLQDSFHARFQARKVVANAVLIFTHLFKLSIHTIF